MERKLGKAIELEWDLCAALLTESLSENLHIVI